MLDAIDTIVIGLKYSYYLFIMQKYVSIILSLGLEEPFRQWRKSGPVFKPSRAVFGRGGSRTAPTFAPLPLGTGIK